MPRPSIGFLFLGGAHQVLHIAPVAMEFERSGGATVTLLAGSEAEHDAVIELWRRAGLANPDVGLLPRSLAVQLVATLFPRWAAKKTLKVIGARALLASFDAVVAAERTCTILKRLPGRKPRLIHIPHGAGDRARGFERRISLFDHVIVAGDKDRDRLIVEGVCRPCDVSVSGYVKLAAVELLPPTGTPRLFENDKPVVLYNPHFAPDLSSWLRFSDTLLSAFAAQHDFNLIVSPHVRLFENATADERRAIERRAIPGRIHIDLGSARSNDMTYALAADVYVGDVSSQVYEFLHVPKPCVFLDAGVGAWKTDPSFGCWHLGEVVSAPSALLAAVARCAAIHPGFVGLQAQARARVLGPTDPGPIRTAARIIAQVAAEA